MAQRERDINGRPYKRFSETKTGDQIEADGGFDCIAAGAALTVESDDHGLFIRCSGPDGKGALASERHYLDGQLEHDSDALIGLYPAA